MKYSSDLRRRDNLARRGCLAIVLVALCSLACVSQASAEDQEKAPPESRRIIPAPLKDLGRKYKVRLIYFVPKDREVKEQYRERIEILMRVVADVYKRDLNAKGYKTRGLDFEFDKDGKFEVHLIRGDHKAEFYTGKPANTDRLFQSTMDEMVKKVGEPTNRACLIFSEAGGIAEAIPTYPYGGVGMVSGDVLRKEITAMTIEKQIEYMFDMTPVRKIGGKDLETRSKAVQVGNGVLMHELGHVFYMLHDARKVDRNIMAYGYHNLRKIFDKKLAPQQLVRFSEDHARMAANTRFFKEEFDESDGEEPKIEFEITRTPQPGETSIQFKLKASDNEGLAAIVIMQRPGDVLVSAGEMKGKKVEIESALPTGFALRPGWNISYILNVMDVNGNCTQIQKVVQVATEKKDEKKE